LFVRWGPRLPCSWSRLWSRLRWISALQSTARPRGGSFWSQFWGQLRSRFGANYWLASLNGSNVSDGCWCRSRLRSRSRSRLQANLWPRSYCRSIFLAGAGGFGGGVGSGVASRRTRCSETSTVPIAYAKGLLSPRGVGGGRQTELRRGSVSRHQSVAAYFERAS
jgi:hypothetical protein